MVKAVRNSRELEILGMIEFEVPNLRIIQHTWSLNRSLFHSTGVSNEAKSILTGILVLKIADFLPYSW